MSRCYNLDFKAKFNDYVLEFEGYIRNYMHSISEVDSTLYEAMNYSALSGGKRIRPVVMLAFCDMLCGDKNNVYPFACALEMVHTYSLDLKMEDIE